MGVTWLSMGVTVSFYLCSLAALWNKGILRTPEKGKIGKIQRLRMGPGMCNVTWK